jgi:hypothetical protein
LGVSDKFPHQQQMVDYAWLSLFLERNPEVSIRQAEGIVVGESTKNEERGNTQFFKMLEAVLKKHDLLNKLQSAFSIDESGIRLTNTESSNKGKCRRCARSYPSR